MFPFLQELSFYFLCVVIRKFRPPSLRPCFFLLCGEVRSSLILLYPSPLFLDLFCRVSNLPVFLPPYYYVYSHPFSVTRDLVLPTDVSSSPENEGLSYTSFPLPHAEGLIQGIYSSSACSPLLVERPRIRRSLPLDPESELAKVNHSHGFVATNLGHTLFPRSPVKSSLQTPLLIL